MGIGVRFQQQKVVARPAAQNHPFQPVEIVETILGGFADRGAKKKLLALSCQRAGLLTAKS